MSSTSATTAPTPSTTAFRCSSTAAFSKGLFFRVAYTYGKLLDDSSEVFTTFASPTSYSANLAGNGLHQDWGPSAYDRRNIVVITYSWTPMGLRSQNFAANLLLRRLHS